MQNQPRYERDKDLNNITRGELLLEKVNILKERSLLDTIDELVDVDMTSMTINDFSETMFKKWDKFDDAIIALFYVPYFDNPKTMENGNMFYDLIKSIINFKLLLENNHYSEGKFFIGTAEAIDLIVEYGKLIKIVDEYRNPTIETIAKSRIKYGTGNN